MADCLLESSLHCINLGMLFKYTKLMPAGVTAQRTLNEACYQFSDNKREINIGGSCFWFSSYSSVNQIFVSLSVTRSKTLIEMSASMLHQRQLSSCLVHNSSKPWHRMSLLINQLKNEYSFMHEWNGMQKKRKLEDFTWAWCFLFCFRRFNTCSNQFHDLLNLFKKNRQ